MASSRRPSPSTPSRSRKKQSRRRRRGRRRGFGAVLTFFCIALIMAAVLAAMLVFFEIRSVTVLGETQYNSEDIIKASDIKVGGNMFLFNKFSAISRIFNDYPYIDEVTIRRKLPDKIEISVTRCTAVAQLEDKTGIYLVDKSGKLLEKIEQKRDNCTTIQNCELNEPLIGKKCVFIDKEKHKPLFLVLNTALNSDILKNIGEIDFSQTFNVSFSYLDRFTVKLGTSENLDRKLRYMQTVIESLDSAARGTIDVSDLTTARFRPYQ